MQTVIISPRLDIILAHQIQRADQLHALEVDAVKLRHHRLHLRTVEHSHEDRLDDIIVMMAECNLVAAELLCKMIQMAAAHSRAEITRGIFHMVDRIENVCLEMVIGMWRLFALSSITLRFSGLYPGSMTTNFTSKSNLL